MEVNQEVLDLLAKNAGFVDYQDMNARVKAEKQAKLEAARKIEEDLRQAGILAELMAKDKKILNHFSECFSVTIAGRHILKVKTMDCFVCPECGAVLNEVRNCLHDLLDRCDPTGRIEDPDLRVVGRFGSVPVLIEATTCAKCGVVSRVVAQVKLP